MQMKQFLNPILSLKKHLLRLFISGVTLMLATSLTTLFWVTPALATALYEIPNLTPETWIVDEAEVISRINEGKITTDLEELAKQSGNEVRIVTVRRLDYGETPETFSKALFEKWFPTTEAQANQTLLMIDTVTNGTAIISGDKSKTVLTSDIATSIANETLLAPLRDGNKYNQAFLDASDRLVAVLSGQPDPGPPQIIEKVQAERTFKTAEETEEERGNATAWVVGLLIAATVIPMATYYIYQVNQPSNNG
jgi:uncharacterized protein